MNHCYLPWNHGKILENWFYCAFFFRPLGSGQKQPIPPVSPKGKPVWVCMQDALTVDVTSPTAAWLHFLFCTSWQITVFTAAPLQPLKKICINNCLWLFFKGKCLRPKPRSPPRSLALLNLQGSLEVCLAGITAKWRVRGCTESCFFHCISAPG